jgi:hypothetical protein
MLDRIAVNRAITGAGINGACQRLEHALWL